MGYRVALMPVSVGPNLDSAKRVYQRWPTAGVDSTIESEAALRAMLERWPSLAERPSRFSGSFVVDEEAPFQVDIDNGLIVLDVSWGSLVDVLPDVHTLASKAGLAMFLPFEGEISKRDENDFREAFQYAGRLILPEDEVDLSVEWFVRQTIESRDIEQQVEDAHLPIGTWSHAQADGGSSTGQALVETTGHVIFLWPNACADVLTAEARVHELTGESASATVHLAGGDRSRIVAAIAFLDGVATSINDHVANRTETTVEDLGVAVKMRVRADLVETLGHAAALAGQRFGLQMFDATARALV